MDDKKEEKEEFQYLSTSTCHPRMIESINALIQRFELYLPLQITNFDPYNIQMISELLLPTAPIKSAFGSLTPVPPPITPSSSESKVSSTFNRPNIHSRAK